MGEPEGALLAFNGCLNGTITARLLTGTRPTSRSLRWCRLGGSKRLGRASGLTVCFGRKDPYSIHLTALVALFRLRVFLLHLPKRFRHVLDLIPNIKTYVDRRALLSRHRDTIAGSCIYFDDLLLLRFVL